ncbi:MAG: glycoside hydrolase family 13 protein [candidate division KSB1 bacterium]|nr:glycoside hydrolase family 13 protein [candidate division KSB1 bacterium]MDZ7358887.1 glycoside hydrolase family 13 protein [candidate division KSB1 bacterium]
MALIILNCTSPKKATIPVVPSWAKQAIWYQIFPERFWNGDKNNDPKITDLAGGWPHFQPEQWQIHPWTSDWYQLQPWEKAYQKDFYWCAGLRRYGGDLQGVLDRLDYLQELGINAIYFNPLFESPSLHKYDATMYHHIDNNFGPDPEMDRQIWVHEHPADPSTWQWTTADSLFLKLIQQCHERGIKVILDGVFNHVGLTFWAFQDVMKNQQASRYKDWFTIKCWDDPNTPENEFDYEGWYGVKDLPEFREDQNGLVTGPREHIHAIVKRWMDPNGDGDPSDGIDGWRLDVAEKVSIAFWRDFRDWVKSINPEAYITGEIWWEDWGKNKMMNAKSWLQGDAFDGVMNYRVAQAIKQFIIDQKHQISARAFLDSLQTIFSDYGWDHSLVCQNLIDSHDVDRLASQIVNPDRWYDHWAAPKDNPNYDVRKPNQSEWAKLRLVVVIQMTLPGAPMIYYGDEAGMWGGDDPDCRKPMVWPELNYEDEVSHPFGKPRPADKVLFDRELFDFYRSIIKIRKDHPALMVGSFRGVLIDNDRSLFCFERNYLNASALIVINNSDRAQTLTLNVDSRYWIDALTANSFMAVDGKIELKIDRFSGIILLPGIETRLAN